MKFDNDILLELLKLNTLLANLPKTNVYTVPKGYFEFLSTGILSAINQENQNENSNLLGGYQPENNNSLFTNNDSKTQYSDAFIEEEVVSFNSVLADAQKINVFKVPPHYFEKLSEQILLNLKIYESVDQEDISLKLYPIPKTSVYEVPNGYFENLSSKILDKLSSATNNDMDDREILLSIPHTKNTNVFEAPSGYFENLPSTIIDKLELHKESDVITELKALSPLLHSIQHINVFNVPSGYFNNTDIPSLLSVTTVSETKVVRMGKRNLFLKIAAAAIFIGAMALGVYSYFGSISGNKSSGFNIAKAVDSPKLDPSIEKGKGMNEQELIFAINNLTKDDINNYLEKNAGEEDIAAITLDVDGKGLPNKDDYLINEKTLDNYLNTLNSHN